MNEDYKSHTCGRRDENGVKGAGCVNRTKSDNPKTARGAAQIDNFFGWRKMGETYRPQTYCRVCRSDHARIMRERRTAEEIGELLEKATIKKIETPKKTSVSKKKKVKSKKKGPCRASDRVKAKLKGKKK